MGKPLKRAVKGQGPNLLFAESANELIDVINLLATMTLAPKSFGELKLSESGYVLDLNGLRDYIDQRIEDQLGEYIANNLGVNATCNDDGTLSVSLFSK